ncbi:type II secretion system F family protein [Brevibacterium samyangense]|uniref:Type II secretion system F family protein n=1 Tax=Brevibacterium samyangense TaxID=366888 RepID=A0ABN2T8R6_9MICO
MSTSLAGALCGLGIGLGLFLVWWSAWNDPPRRRQPARWVVDTADMLTTAGLPRMRPHHLVLVSLGVGALVLLLGYFFTSSPVISACFALIAATAPPVYVRHRALSRQVERRALWPEAIDHLGSGVRAGMSLPEAIGGLAVRGPETLRPLFAVFAAEYRATGSFRMSLERFKAACADPVADRIVAALVVTREVGGTDLGTMLGTLSTFLREDARTRSELRARQSWTVTGARLAVAAPWIVLALLSTRPETAAAYNTAQGASLLLVGLVVSVVAYAVMKRIGRLPAEPRVLR